MHELTLFALKVIDIWKNNFQEPTKRKVHNYILLRNVWMAFTEGVQR